MRREPAGRVRDAVSFRAGPGVAAASHRRGGGGACGDHGRLRGRCARACRDSDEAEERVGGWLRAGSAPAIKFDVANYLAHLEHRLAAAIHRHGLEFRSGTAASPEALQAEGYDAILCCTGSVPIRPPQAEDAPLPAALAVDVLLQRALVRDARRIVVVGGGDVGCETAHMLAFELGKEVSVVERSASLMGSSCTANRGYLLRALSRQGVRLMPAARVTRLHAGGVDLVVNRSSAVPDPDAVWRPVLPPNTRNPFARGPEIAEVACALDADMVVFAVGVRPNAMLHHDCLARRTAPEIQAIGDCFRTGRILDATRNAQAVAISL